MKRGKVLATAALSILPFIPTANAEKDLGFFTTHSYEPTGVRAFSPEGEEYLGDFFDIDKTQFKVKIKNVGDENATAIPHYVLKDLGGNILTEGDYGTIAELPPSESKERSKTLHLDELDLEPNTSYIFSSELLDASDSAPYQDADLANNTISREFTTIPETQTIFYGLSGLSAILSSSRIFRKKR